MSASESAQSCSCSRAGPTSIGKLFVRCDWSEIEFVILEEFAQQDSAKELISDSSVLSEESRILQEHKTEEDQSKRR